MYFTIGKESQLNDLLNRICEKLQLDKTRRDRVKTSYEYLCKWIEEDEDYFSKFEKIEFYAQGSYRTMTTCKPYTGEEYDLDFVLELQGEWTSEDPMELINELERRLLENETYKDKIEKKTRCVRINYKNEFHIDILPGFPEAIESSKNDIKVPDRTLKDWTDSNPKDYATWFDDNSNKVDIVILEKKAMSSIEPLPENTPYGYVQPLRRAVQLMKRFRSVYYKDNNERAPRSIILTTLAADYYNGEQSEYEAILNILNGIHSSIINNKGKVIEVYNPMNLKEKLSEKWDKDPFLYKEFSSFIKYFREQWINLLSLATLEEKAVVLRELFGESVSKEVILEQAQYITKARKNGDLLIDTASGVIYGSGSTLATTSQYQPIPQNTFYGE